MKRCWLVLAISAILAVGFLLSGCWGSTWEHKSTLTEKTGYLEAKDRPAGTSCDQANIVIQDCLDACSCCFQGQDVGQNSNINGCVSFCDNLLAKENDSDVNPVWADYHQYAECTLGCLSTCGAAVSDPHVCWNECKQYLDVH